MRPQSSVLLPGELPDKILRKALDVENLVFQRQGPLTGPSALPCRSTCPGAPWVAKSTPPSEKNSNFPLDNVIISLYNVI
jgi:hypothetical protein